MAEFVQTMKDWMRMCLSFKSCDDCPMMDADGWAHILCSEGGIQSAKPEIAEKVIMKWAAEHSEPVYPTWYDFLQSVGAISEYGGKFRFKDRIPADIAKKFGIEPEEKDPLKQKHCKDCILFDPVHGWCNVGSDTEPDTEACQWFTEIESEDGACKRCL